MRDASKVNYSMHDCLMSGFAMMFFQDPSILQFQESLQKYYRSNNLRTVFKVSNIPKETQMRDVIDNVPSEAITPVFKEFFRHLQRGKHLEQYEFLSGKYLVSIDASSYFSSSKVSCPNCLEKNAGSPTKKTTYSHMILQSVMMHPDMKQVLPLVPEEIVKQDGSVKQDCELNAGKRLLKELRRVHPKLGLIIAGDGLYSKQPFITDLTGHGMSYILVAKHTDHKVLKEQVEEARLLGTISRKEHVDEKGRTHIYEWKNGLDLNGNKNSVAVNHFEYWLENGGKTTYHNSWVTDITLDEHNIEKMVRGGRSRWKIENETFNTLKNQGYHLEHNFGHGTKHLSYNLFLLNLLAFFVHQISELTDTLYQKTRGEFTSRREFWNQLRCTFRILLFDSWESFLLKIFDPVGQPP
jgi:hypothetical protein